MENYDIRPKKKPHHMRKAHVMRLVFFIINLWCMI